MHILKNILLFITPLSVKEYVAISLSLGTHLKNLKDENTKKIVHYKRIWC